MSKVKRAKTTSKADDRFRFKSLHTLGAPAAEDDLASYGECYIDTGYQEALLNTNDKRTLILGRTGSGKTRLLERIREARPNRVVRLDPESIAFSYLVDSSVLKDLDDVGVNLDHVFKLLWRHVLCIGALRLHASIDSRDALQKLFDRIGFSDQSKKRLRALKYLEKWGSSHWNESEMRVKEVTTTIEKKVEALLSEALKLGASRTDVQKAELRSAGQEVVNSIPAQELSDVLGALDFLIDDPQNPIYIVIDRLDENWTPSRLRFRLLRSLIEAMRDFYHVKNVKIIACFREDLLQSVFDNTKMPGQQREKYESMYLRLAWTSEQLEAILDLRLKKLVANEGFEDPSTVRAVLPPKSRPGCIEWILERTHLRPRDAISYMNYLLVASVGESQIKSSVATSVETKYSQKRLESIVDEWSEVYPSIQHLLACWPRRRSHVSLSDFDDDVLSDLWGRCHDQRSEFGHRDSLQTALDRYADPDGRASRLEVYCELIAVSYSVGLVGIRFGKNEPVYSYKQSMPSLSDEELQKDSFCVHPMFFGAMDVKPSAS